MSHLITTDEEMIATTGRTLAEQAAYNNSLLEIWNKATPALKAALSKELAPAAKIECTRCGRKVAAKKDGTPRPHVGYINVCGVTVRQEH